MSPTLPHAAAHVCACPKPADWPDRRHTPWLSFRALVRTMLGCIERSRQRQALRHLDDHLLKDIGVSRRAADDEADKPFWL